LQGIISTYDYAYAWFLIGLFSAQNNRQVVIFTDQAENFSSKLLSDGKLKSNVSIHKCEEIQAFSVEKAQNSWSQFNNLEVLS
jgi:hypothetical protein